MLYTKSDPADTNQGPTWSDVASTLQVNANLLDQRGKMNLYLASQLGYLDLMVWQAIQNQSNRNLNANTYSQSSMVNGPYWPQMNMTPADSGYANLNSAIPPGTQVNAEINSVWSEYSRKTAMFQSVAGMDDAHSWMKLISDGWVKDSVRRLLVFPRVAENVGKNIPNRRFVAMHCFELVSRNITSNQYYLDKMWSMIDYANPREFSVALLDLGTACINQSAEKIIDRLIANVDSASRYEKNNEWLQDSELRREFFYAFSRELNDQAITSIAPGEISVDYLLFRFSQNSPSRELWVAYSNKFKRRVAARAVRANEKDRVKNFTARMPVELIDKFKRVEMIYALTREQLLEVLIEGCLNGRINIQSEANQMRVKLRRKYAVVEPVQVRVDGATPDNIVGHVEDDLQSVHSSSRVAPQSDPNLLPPEPH